MGGEIRIATFLAAFTASCGGAEAPRQVDQPTLETLEPAAQGAAASLGKQAPPGFYRSCETVAAGGGLVELHCDDYQIVEFRKPESSGTGDADLNDLLTLLGARFGELSEKRRDARIDSLAIRVSDFASVDESGPRGMAASVSNSQGQYWTFACYKKVGEIEKDFCGDAIATAARAGGLAYVQAKSLVEFGGGQIKVAAGCQSTPGSRISCATGQLSWSPRDGRDALTLRDETLARIETMARQEKVNLHKKELACKLLGKEALCLKLQLTSAEEALHFVLVTGGEQERLVVCSYPESKEALLPEPCRQAIDLVLPKSSMPCGD